MTMNTIENTEFTEKSDFVKAINSLRLNSKGKWYAWVGIVEGKKVELKGFGTWLQILRVNGLNHAPCPDIPVSRFKEHLQSV